YSLGRVLYCMATANPVEKYPTLPGDLEKPAARLALGDLEQIYHRACSDDLSQRYGHAGEMRDALLAVRTGVPLTKGKPVRNLHRKARVYEFAKRLVPPAAALAIAAAVGFQQWHLNQKRTAEFLRLRVGSHLAYGSPALAEGDSLRALPWFTEAFHLDK